MPEPDREREYTERERVVWKNGDKAVAVYGYSKREVDITVMAVVGIYAMVRFKGCAPFIVDSRTLRPSERQEPPK